MTYYDDDVYNENNLKKEDLNALRLWEMIVNDSIDSAEVSETDYPMVNEIIETIAQSVKDAIREGFERRVYEYIVATIEGYEEYEGEK